MGVDGPESRAAPDVPGGEPATGAFRGATSYHCRIDTLTILSTDIEGSTALLRRVGDDAYSAILAEHHRIIRRSVSGHGGREEGTQGDSFLVTFASPKACVAAALEMQVDLTRHAWPGGDRPRVRMGIHAGEALSASTGLVGYEVHRAVRVAAVSYGGQILLSSAAAGLVEHALPDGAHLRSLGAHRLKDLGQPESLFQLMAPGLEHDFAPLRSLDSPELPNNLPAALSPFIGRTIEVAEVRSLVEQRRLVTLTGSAGSGKTRLALQVAAEMLDGTGEGVWYVELAAISDPTRVPSVIADSLRVRLDPGLLPLESLVRVLRDQSILLILDNCEHLVESVADVAELIARRCGRVHIVATSREPLGVRGEEVYRVRPLSLPSVDVEDAADLAGADAVDLFVTRARSLNRTFGLDDANAALVAMVCRRLDGIPLAIELAAARLSAMSLADLHARLDQRFPLLSGGSRHALPRQQTLLATVAWSYDLLDEAERGLLRQLSVFVNGFDLAAAETVCVPGSADPIEVADILESLVNKSLVIAEHASTSVRYRFLETIRDYACARLLEADGEEAALLLRRRHAEHYLALVEEAAPNLPAGPRQVEWMRGLSLEWDNLQAALAFFDAEPDGAEEVMRFCVAIWWFAQMRRHREPVPYLERALARDTGVSASLRAWSLLTLANLLNMESFYKDDEHGDYERLERLNAEAESTAREIGDMALLGWALRGRALATDHFGDREGATALLEEAVRAISSPGHENEVGWMTISLAIQLPHVERMPLLAAASEHFRRGGGLRGLGTALFWMGVSHAHRGFPTEEWLKLFREAVSIAEELGDDNVLFDELGVLAVAYFGVGDMDNARQSARRSLMLGRRQGRSATESCQAIFVLASCHTCDGDLERGAQLLSFVLHFVESVESKYWYWSPAEVMMRNNCIAMLIEGLGREEYEHQRVLGQQMTVDQATNVALGRTSVLS